MNNQLFELMLQYLDAKTLNLVLSIVRVLLLRLIKFVKSIILILHMMANILFGSYLMVICEKSCIIYKLCQ